MNDTLPTPADVAKPAWATGVVIYQDDDAVEFDFVLDIGGVHASTPYAIKDGRVIEPEDARPHVDVRFEGHVDARQLAELAMDLLATAFRIDTDRTLGDPTSSSNIARVLVGVRDRMREAESPEGQA